MGILRLPCLLLGLLFLVCSLQGKPCNGDLIGSLGSPVEGETNCSIPETNLTRYSFPTGFVFGTATSAYQVEGAANETYGRGPSVWDNFTHQYPEKIADQSNGDVAIDFYDLYKADIQRMKAMNMDVFRFSISWSRLIPSGKVSDKVNLQGIKFYSNLIDTIISNGMTPFVTIFHWDTPQGLEDEYGGFLNSNIVDDFRDYANLCFQLFGDRVKYWITLNEPWAYSAWGYDKGIFAPGRCSSWVNFTCPGATDQICNCSAGNSSTEPYIVSHNLLLSHAAAVELYREKYQTSQNGSIGTTINSFWYEPGSETDVDKDATQRMLDFEFGWFMNPITYGDYPAIMRELVGDRLPYFTSEESASLQGSYDFLGLNYYSAYYVESIVPDPEYPRYLTDSWANSSSTARNGSLIGPQAGVDWFYIYPEGLLKLLKYTKNTYNSPTIYITENGFADMNNSSLTLEQALNDTCRTKYFIDHLTMVNQSIVEDKVNVKGYLAWSYADNFEWASGYTVRFGITYINYTDLSRHAKNSSHWFTQFLTPDDTEDGLIQMPSVGFSQLMRSKISKFLGTKTQTQIDGLGNQIQKPNSQLPSSKRLFRKYLQEDLF